MRRVLCLIPFLLLGFACEDGRPTPPSALPPTTAPPAPAPPAIPVALTLSGVVYGTSPAGRRPLEGVDLDISPDSQSRSPLTSTDTDGRYEASGISATDKVVAEKAGYSQPCRMPASLARDGILDVELVSDAILSTTGVPPTMPIRQPTLSGVVFEPTPEGHRPIAGANVVLDFSGGYGWGPGAFTKTDAKGHYLLCGIEDTLGVGLFIYVSKPEYDPSYLPVSPPRTNRFDVELKPR